jgi:hypothetical protein
MQSQRKDWYFLQSKLPSIVVKNLQKQRVMKSKNESREEMGGIGTAFFLGFVVICVIIATIQAIFNIL